MRLVVAGLVCLTALFMIDRVVFHGAYVSALKSSAAESATYYR